MLQGIGFGGRVRKYLEFVAGGLGMRVVKGSVSSTLEPMTEQAKQRMTKTLAEQSRRFHAELLRPTYPVPSLFELTMSRMGRAGIKVGAPKDKRDYAYYRDQGWFESEYCYAVRLGPVKKAAGALFDWLGANLPMFKVAKQ